MEKENKEIDFLELIKLLRSTFLKGLSYFLDFIVWSIRLVLKNFILFSIFLILGIVWSLYSIKPEHRYNYSEFTLHLNVLDCFAYNDELKSINNTLMSNPEEFAKKIGGDKYSVSKIEFIEGFYYVDLNSNGTADLINYSNSITEISDSSQVIVRDRLRVRINSFARINAKRVQDCIVSMLNESPQLKLRNNARLERLNAYLKKLDEEIVELDSLRKLEFYNQQPNIKIKDNFIVGERFDYSARILDLSQKREQLIEERITRPNPVTLVSPVVVQEKRDNKYIYITRIGFAMLIALILSLFITYRKQIWTAIKPIK